MRLLALALASIVTSGLYASSRPYRLIDLDAHGIPPLLGGISSPAEWENKRSEIDAIWRDYLGPAPDRPAPAPRVLSEVPFPDHVRYKLEYATAHADTVTAYLLVPRAALEPGAARRAAVLALHPTNPDGKSSVATPEGRKNRMYGLELVRRGYIVLAPDALTSGERIFPGRQAFDSGPFYERHPTWNTVAKNIVDHLQAIDVLVADPRVDPDRIGAIGHSFGAYNAYFLAGQDPRVKVLVASCGICPFTNTRDLPHWGPRSFPYTHFPRIGEDTARGVVPFEFNEIIALVAPRPQFHYAAQGDKYFQNWKEVGAVLADVRSLYAFLGREHAFQSLIGVGGHDFPPEIREVAYRFLDEHLRPDADAGRP